MFVFEQSIPAEPKPEADLAAEDARYYRRVLHGLIDMAADLAGLVHRQAMEQAAEQAAGRDEEDGERLRAPDATARFDRMARTIRRTIALARHVAEPVASSVPAPRVAARKRIIRDVEDAIQRTAEGDEAEGLEAELRERMDAPDLEDDIAGRPVADIVADICRDLGIAASPGSHPWKRRTPGDLTELFARAAGVGASISGAGVGLAGVPRSVRPSTGGMRAVVPGGRTGSDPPPERVGGSPLFDTRFGVWTPHPDPLPQGERESDPGTCTLGEGWRS